MFYSNPHFQASNPPMRLTLKMARGNLDSFG